MCPRSLPESYGAVEGTVDVQPGWKPTQVFVSGVWVFELQGINCRVDLAPARVLPGPKDNYGREAMP